MEVDLNEHQDWDEHPLTNFVVLKEVLKYDTSPQTTTRNRLVSPSWREACSRSWLKLMKSPVLRYTDHTVGGNGQPVDNKRRIFSLSLPEFYELYQAYNPVSMQILATSIRKMDLYTWQFLEEEDTGATSPKVNRWFWNWFATPWLATLTLVDCEFKREAWVFKERFLKMLPGLMNLTIRDCVVHTQALRDINQAHQRWMEYEGRVNWKRERMTERSQPIRLRFSQLFPAQPPLPTNHNNLSYFEAGYKHDLSSLDVSLKVAVEENENGAPFALKPKTPLRIWGPLLAMLPKLKTLRVGGYHEDTEEPPPTLKPPDWDNDIHHVIKTLEQDPHNSFLFEYLKRRKVRWFGDGASTWNSSSSTTPLHVGNFWELIWEEAIGQVEASLESLDLLDFSGRAQHYGVISICEAAAQYKERLGNVYFFPQMKHVALDLGLNPCFAELDLMILLRRIGNPRCLKFYRAPFDSAFPTFCGYEQKQVDELELWGNVSPNMNFLFASFKGIRKLCWTTSCFDKEFSGQRLYHLMQEGRSAFPLFRKDLVASTDWSEINVCVGLPQLRHLEIDWGPMSKESWRQLCKVMYNLTKLKAMILDDEQLAEISRLLPRLQFLELVHGSRLTAQGLAEHLPKVANLKQFTWVKCACTMKLFQVDENADILRKVGMRLKNQLSQQVVITLPWNVADNTSSSQSQAQQVCIQAEFEQALLTGESTTFFQAINTEL